MLKEIEIGFLICATVIISFQIRPTNGYTRLQASTNYACVGENVTFSCATSNSFLIWEVTFTDRTIGSITHSFQRNDREGRLFSESIRGVRLHFQLASNRNEILDSILVVHTSALVENAVIKCETHRLTVRLAYPPNTPTGIQISEKIYNSSEFASVTLNWNDPVGRVDSYNIKISIGSSDSESQQFSVVMPGLKLTQIPYNENVTIGISTVNCAAESEEVDISFIISACDFNLSLPHDRLLYNNSSGSYSFNRVVPSGEQIWFGCEQGFSPREPMVTTCQEAGLWYPDPSEVACQKECLVPVNLTNLELSLINSDDSESTSSRIFFHCKDGFIPRDEQTAVCSSNGTWLPDLTQFECHRSTATLTNTSNGDDNSCTNCLIYVISGSVVGIATLLVVCALLFAVMICIIIRTKNSDASNRDHGRPELAVYEYITGPVYECLNPIVTSVMTENEAYNSCHEEIRAYDIV